MFRLIAAASAVIMLSSPAGAGERLYLGHGRLVTNDLLGDGHDRWRSGSVSSSRIWGPEWHGDLPHRPGDLLELRIGGHTAAPEDLVTPAPGDRPFAGVLSFGLHTHFSAGATEVSLGGDIAVIGPQTRLDDLQDFLHDIVNGSEMSPAVRGAQIGDDVVPTAVIETGRSFALGDTSQLRPFVEGRWGLETLVRVGFDLRFGQGAPRDLRMRDEVTGQRYRVYRTDRETSQGFTFVVGGDIAHVSESELLPGSRGFDLTDYRSRLRAGLHWDGRQGHRAFYGLTWLSEEFEAQREGQFLGSIRLDIAF